MPLNDYGNPFLDVLEEEPQLAYQSRLNESDYSPSKKRVLQQGFQESRNQFLGVLGSMIRGGQDPTARYENFLNGGQGGFDFDRYYNSLSPNQRGMGRTSHLTPRVRHLTRF